MLTSSNCFYISTTWSFLLLVFRALERAPVAISCFWDYWGTMTLVPLMFSLFSSSQLADSISWSSSDARLIFEYCPWFESYWLNSNWLFLVDIAFWLELPGIWICSLWTCRVKGFSYIYWIPPFSGSVMILGFCALSLELENIAWFYWPRKFGGIWDSGGLAVVLCDPSSLWELG